MWLVVIDGGIPLSEVMKWDLEDVDNFHAIRAMRADHEAAHRAFREEEAKSKKGE